MRSFRAVSGSRFGKDKRGKAKAGVDDELTISKLSFEDTASSINLRHKIADLCEGESTYDIAAALSITTAKLLMLVKPKDRDEIFQVFFHSQNEAGREEGPTSQEANCPSFLEIMDRRSRRTDCQEKNSNAAKGNNHNSIENKTCGAMTEKKYNVWVKQDGRWVPLIGQHGNGRPIFDMGKLSVWAIRENRLALSLDDARKWTLLLADQDPRITDDGSPRPTD
ncbi:MAG TPA: hypothetical protein VGI36_20210 [Candidatus Binataceae bacterium]|jgi:hypothetical protein